MRHFLFVAAALAATSFAAHATIMTSTTPSTTTPANGLMTSYSGVSTITFNGSTSDPAGFTGGAVVQGSSATQYAEPNGDTSNYFIVGAPPSYSGTASFSTGGSYNYFGVYWGSIDAYNTITFLSSSNTVVGTFTGSLFPPSDGSQTSANSSEYVDFLFSNGASYSTVDFSTTSANFELDNVAYGNVAATPEPSSLALLGTGLLSVVGVARRRFV